MDDVQHGSIERICVMPDRIDMPLVVLDAAGLAYRVSVVENLTISNAEMSNSSSIGMRRTRLVQTPSVRGDRC